MKNLLKRIEIKIAIFLVVLFTISVFAGINLVLLILATILLSASIVSDYREYQESDEFINSLYN